MQLYPDQDDLTYNIAISLSKHRKTCVQLSTGGGKTVIFSNIISRWINKQRTSTLTFVHREELLEQTRRTLYKEFNIEAIPITKGMKYIPPADCYVGMIESTFKRLHKVKPCLLIIIDECHRAEFNKVHAEFPEAKILGFTATPISSSKKHPLKSYYEDIVCGLQVKELIALGRLSQDIMYAPEGTVRHEDLKIKGGEFEDEDMANQYRKPRHIKNTVQAYEDRGVGLKTIIFNVNLQHSRDVAAAFNAAGYPCRHLGSDNNHERKEIMAWLKNTPSAILSNVGIATTGLDEPSIEHIIFNKSTLSLTLWLQCLGRGGRIIKHLKSLFYVTDMGNNWRLHGEWSQDRNWKDLFFFPEKAKKPGVPPIKSCPACDAIIPASAIKCKWCGHEFPKKELAPEEKLNEFVVVTKGINVKQIIESNTDKKEYWTLFEIGRRIAVAMKEKEVILNEASFSFALNTYHAIAKQWTKERGKKFNEFHRSIVHNSLTAELKVLYPEWQLSPPQ